VLAATVELTEPHGESVIVDLRFGGAALKARIFSGVQFRESQKVQIGINPARAHLFDAEGQRLDQAPGPSSKLPAHSLISLGTASSILRRSASSA